MKHRVRTDKLSPGDYCIMQSPGTIRGFRLHWEGPYHFDGWTGPPENPIAVLRDDNGQIWYRRNVEVLSYRPEEEFIQKYINPGLQNNPTAPNPDPSQSVQAESSHDPPSSPNRSTHEPEIILEFDSLRPEEFPNFPDNQAQYGLTEQSSEGNVVRRSARQQASNIRALTFEGAYIL